MLLIPTPILSFKPIPPSLAATLEKPIQVQCGPVALPDGKPFSPEHLGAAGLLAYRQKTAASALDVWRDDTKEWVGSATIDPVDLKPLPFFFKTDDPVFPWQGLIVAAGQKDKDDNDQFEKAVGLFPRYAFRAFFKQKKEEDDQGSSVVLGLSTPSPDIQFISFLDSLQAGIRVDDGNTPEDATEIHLFLRDANLQLLGSVAIYNDSGQAQIEIKKEGAGGAPGSTICMKADGSIEILGPETSPNQRALVRFQTSGDLEIQAAPGRTTRINNVLKITTSGTDVTLQCTGSLTLDAGDITLNANTFSVNAVPVSVPWQVP